MTSNESVLLLPGWLNSGRAHWQSLWEARHGYRRVEQDDWTWPRRGDWCARLEEVVLAATAPVVLVAHSLGCHLVAAWAAHSHHAGRVKAAMLVALPDPERDDMPPNLYSWRPIVRARLPFASLAVISNDDPYCTPSRAAGMAADWGSAVRAAGALGHINGDSGLGDWPQGQAWLAELGRSPTMPRMVTKKPKGLGLGLEALLGPRVADPAPASPGAPHALKLDQLQPGKYQPRTRMDEGSLYELAESIKAQGVMQPVLVRSVGDQRYEIIAGERRVRAARLAGLDEVPVLVKDVPDEAAAAMALIENIQREDLNPLEEAQGLKRLTDEFGLTHEQAAQAVGRSRSAASNLLRLLNLSDPVQQMLMAGDIDMGHARALLPLQGAQQILHANRIVAQKLSVREAEKLVARSNSTTGRQAPLLRTHADKPRDLLRIEQELSDKLTAAVEIRVKRRTRHGEQGEVAIRFGSLDELNGLLERLGLSPE